MAANKHPQFNSSWHSTHTMQARRECVGSACFPTLVQSVAGQTIQMSHRMRQSTASHHCMTTPGFRTYVWFHFPFSWTLTVRWEEPLHRIYSQSKYHASY